MAISYKVVSKKPGGMAGENTPRYYPMVTNRQSADLRAVCEMISERSTLHAADVVGVVESLIDLVPELLLGGYSVKLDGLGVFSLHVSGVGRELPAHVTSRDITGVKVGFLPGKRVKTALSQAKFQKIG
ncbi:HU family DNA-binding protein [Marinoscillum sp.]|uniref:HU family DNA-binding protein n=1 Tax=Marinoscillum sp. TaxID=2024838 RepID=UPI003BAB17F0